MKLCRISKNQNKSRGARLLAKGNSICTGLVKRASVEVEETESEAIVSGAESDERLE